MTAFRNWQALYNAGLVFDETFIDYMLALEADLATALAGSGVTSVAATDGSIVVGGSASAVQLATGTVDVIATNHPPAANWSNNAKKITGLANGSAATDAAAFGQIPAAYSGSGALGPIGDTTHVPVVTTDAQGRVTALTSVSIAAGAVTSITSTGATITITNPSGPVVNIEANAGLAFAMIGLG